MFDRNELRKHIGTKIVVNAGSVTWKGTLHSVANNLVTLEHAEMFNAELGVKKADGLIMMSLNNINYLQLPHVGGDEA